LNDLNAADSEALQRSIARTAKENGFFSIWMQVFNGHEQMRLKLIEAYPGTAQNCFDNHGNTISRPGGKL
jgi:hypothetical protein